MAVFLDREFRGEDIAVDGNEYIRCKFVDCTWVFAGRDFSMQDCSLEGRFNVSLQAHAACSLDFFQVLYAMSPVTRRLVESMLDPKKTGP